VRTRAVCVAQGVKGTWFARFRDAMKNTIAATLLTLALAATAFATETLQIPPGADGARERLNSSPRHGEWVEIKVPDTTAPLKAWVVYPERSEKAPVVIVIQEIYGLTDWIRAVADQLAADGFIGIAPDLLSGHGPGGGGTDSYTDRDAVTKAVRELKPDFVTAALNATREYGLKLPAANGKSATVGYCWGGAASFQYAVNQPELDAAVVYYGTSPETGFDKIQAPVLGLYGENDQRVNATIDRAREKMNEAGKTYVVKIYDGAGHGFLRQQDGQDGANLRASREAWPETVRFIREHAK
jgi:carboxymethylenebutenolidase